MAGPATYPVATIAKLLLLTERRVQQLVAEGVLPKGERGRYELVPVVQGYIRYLRDRALNGDANEPEAGMGDKARLLRAQADLAEMDATMRRGELVERGPVEAGLAAQDLALKDRLLTVPLSAAADALEASAGAGAAGIAEVYAKHIASALADVASSEIVTRVAH